MDAQVVARRRALAGFAALAATPLLCGCESWFAKPIAVAAHVWPGYEPMFLARSEGWLDARQVRLLETASATASLRALLDGKVDGAALTLDETLRARSTGTPLSVVMIFDVSAGADMLLVRPTIRALAELKGRRIGFEQGALGELMLAHVLRAAGLTREDAQLVVLSVDRQRQAWARDQVDAVITYEPVASQLLAQGAHRLFDSSQIPNTIVDVLAMRSDVVDGDHAAAISQLVAASFRALAYLNRNPQGASYRMAAHLGLAPGEVLPAFKGLVLPDAGNNRRLLGGTSPALLATAHSLVTLMLQAGLVKRDDAMAELIHAEFLPTDYPSS